MAPSSPKFAQVDDMLAQVGCKLTASRLKLVPRRPKWSPDAAMHGRSSFHSGFSVLKMVATHNGNQQVARE